MPPKAPAKVEQSWQVVKAHPDHSNLRPALSPADSGTLQASVLTSLGLGFPTSKMGMIISHS